MLQVGAGEGAHGPAHAENLTRNLQVAPHCVARCVGQVLADGQVDVVGGDGGVEASVGVDWTAER